MLANTPEQLKNLKTAQIIDELWELDETNGSSERQMRLMWLAKLGDKTAIDALRPEILRRGTSKKVFDLFELCYQENSTTNINDVFHLWALNEYAYETPVEQYEENLRTLKLFNLYDHENPKQGDVLPPSLEQCQQILKNTLTREQLEVIAKMEKPTFQLIPITGMDRYEAALNSHKPMNNQNNATVADWTRGAFTRSDTREGINANNKGTIIGWRIAITEGKEEPVVLEGDDIQRTLGERLEWFKEEYEKKGIQGVDFKQYMLLMMRGLVQNPPRPIDKWLRSDGSWTLINKEPAHMSRVAGVYWDDGSRGVDLDEARMDNRGILARFRASVVVDVLS